MKHRANAFRRALLRCALVVLGLNALAAPAASGEGNAADIVVVVSPHNPVATLSRTQVADIFLGRAMRFPDGRRAVPVDQAEGSAVREAFNMRMLERTDAQIRAHWARIVFTGRGRPPLDVAGAEEVKRLIAREPNAIGYLERRLVDDSVAVVAVSP